ncbi:MAG TPA: sigma-70 family RNA polymerase sigma factor [Vicinamibacterales bacterium]|jgi:RNA polymerase sigma-70 factor (ECF subfamily)|nr:sigma-70 family RNA polymerase sigma factor [Vicinamibacterales bacterium]
MPSTGPITRLLADWRSGNQAALDQLLPLVYEELRRLAKRQMRREAPGHLLQTTALVHEAYLRLVDQNQIGWQTRAHFYAVAAQVMRHILVDYARGRRRAKRGEGVPAMSLDDVAVLSDDRVEEVIGVHVALERLSMLDPRKGRVFELRYFGGMSIDEAADVLQVSPATVARDWRMAKAWLRRAIGEGANDAA